jgi:putative phage-type endonuclease
MQLTPQILKERKTGIGGSDCAAVLGLSKWSTPLDIYLSKINPDSIPIETTEAMEDGHDCEPIAIKRYTKATGYKIEQPNKIFKNDKYPWLLANVDGLVVDQDIILEAKSTKFFKDQWGETGTDEMPDQYLFQVAHYCIVLDMPRADLAAWSFGEPLRIYHYERNKGLEEKIIELTHNFWFKHVKEMIPPDPVNNEDIIKLYRKGDETKTMVADDITENLCYEHKQIKNNISELEKREKFLAMEIKGAMKDHANLVALDDTPLATWTNQTSNKFQTKDFKADNAEQYKQYCKPVESRVLRNKVKIGV